MVAGTVHRIRNGSSAQRISGGCKANFDDVKVVQVSTKGKLDYAVSSGSAALQSELKEGSQKSEDDLRELDATWNQLSGLALINKDGIVHWVDIEAPNTFTGFNHIASIAQIPAAARELSE